MKKFLYMMMVAVMIAAMAGCTKEETVAVSNEAVQVEDVVEDTVEEDSEEVEVSDSVSEDPVDELAEEPTEDDQTEFKDETSDSTITAVIVEKNDPNRPTQEFLDMTGEEEREVFRISDTEGFIKKYNKLMVWKILKCYSMGGPISLETHEKYNIGKKNEAADCATLFSGANGYPIKWYQSDVPIWEIDKAFDTLSSYDGSELVLYQYERKGYVPLIYVDHLIPSLNEPEVYLDKNEIKNYEVINSRGELITNKLVAAEDMGYDFTKGEKITVSWTQGSKVYKYELTADSVYFAPTYTVPYRTLEGKVFEGLNGSDFDFLSLDEGEEIEPGYYYARSDYVSDNGAVGIDAWGFFYVPPAA